jgi:hypothetical protein
LSGGCQSCRHAAGRCWQAGSSGAGRVVIAMSEEIQNRAWIESHLEAVAFVSWDRFTVGDWNGEQAVSVYGWIGRDRDEYKDFVLLIFWPESEEFYYATSSEERTHEIYEILVGEDSDEHNECRRVEHTFRIENAIELHEQSTLVESAGGDRS